jgi:hypothetical protein
LAPVKTILGGVGILAVLTYAAMHRPSPAETKPVAHDRFDVAWSDVMQTTGGSVLRKADQERVATSEPVPVQTERIVPPTKIPPVVLVEEERTEDSPRRSRSRKQRHAAVRDVCTRHGMHKVVTRGGKSWRCKK